MPQIVMDDIAARNLVPGVKSEVNKLGAGSQSFLLPKRILLIGGRTSAGTVAAGTLVRITGDGQGATYHGTGSHLAQMVDVARSFSPKARRTEIWTIGVTDDGSGVAATGIIVFAGTATETLPLVLLIGGRRLQVPVSTGDAHTAVASAVAAASYTDFAVTAGVASATVTFTARNDGPGGNDISIVVLQRPAGITATVTGMASGATNPDLAATITAMAGQQWTHIACSFNDDGSADDLEAELETRSGPYVDLRGHLFLGYRGSLANALTYGAARNSEFCSVGHLHLGPSTPWEIAAWLCMADAEQDDPSRSRNGISGGPSSSRGFEGRRPTGLTPTARENLLQSEDHEMLLDAGITPLVVDDNGRISVLRLITTRQTDDVGAASDLQLDIMVPRTLAAQIYTLQVYIKRLHPNSKKGRDGDEEKAANIATPKLLKTQIAGLFLSTWVPLGWVPFSALQQFLDELIIEDDPTDVSRFNCQFPTCIIPSLHVVAVKFVLTIG
jgi:phage tail sheath gpL-like